MNSTNNHISPHLIHRTARLLFLFLLTTFIQASAQGLIIPSGSYVIQTAGLLATQNNWVNNGSFTAGSGTVVFNGTTQTLGGSVPTTFNNIILEPGSSTSIISAGQQLTGALQSNDSLYCNGNLTLLSTAAQTALIDGSGTGEVVGNLTMQRYLSTAFGYHYFSSPFKADTVGNFANVISLTTSFPDVYSYNENDSTNGWINYTTGSGILTPLAGYAVNFGTSTAALTASLTGVVSNHTQSVTLYNHNLTYTLGFNLVGNPYPSPIDWNSSTGWTKTNIDNALYFFQNGTTNQYTGTYSSYINGVSSDGVASNLIPAMQGFFIHVSNGTYPVTGLLSVSNTARNTSSNVAFYGVGTTGPANGPPPLLRLTAGFTGDTSLYDPMVIYLEDGATPSFNKELDALKLMNTHIGVPSLYAVSQDNQQLSIQALPYPGTALQTIPLGLKTAQDGQVSFSVRDREQLPASLHIYFSDTKTGTLQDLGQTPSYQLYLPQGTYSNRFYLELSTTALQTTPGTTPVSGPFFEAWSAGNQLYLRSNLPAGQQAGLDIFDATGRLIYRGSISDNTTHLIRLPAVAAGIYIVSLSDGSTIQSKKIFIGGNP